MKRVGDFFKRIKVNKNTMPINETNKTQEIEIEIEGNIDLFKNEKEKIIEGAKQLLESGNAENIEDAIVTFAVMFRGLRFSETKNTEDGKRVIVLRETAHKTEEIFNDGDEIEF